MQRKYLEDIGVEWSPDKWCPSDDRQAIWESERAIYGFDSRETWSLDTTFYMWLYERLMMFREKANEIVNLEYHTYDYNGNNYTQLQLIDMMIERLRLYLSDEYGNLDEEQYNYVHEIEKIWAIILPDMWW